MNKVFPDQYRDHVRFNSECGSREVKTYTPKLSDDGVITLVESGKVNRYEQIQSYRDSCDINLLVARFNNGETDVFSRVQGAYGDFSDMPRTYADMLQRVIDARQFFDSLPLPTRQKFDCNFEQFIMSMDNPGFLDNFVEKKEPVAVEPVPAGEDGGAKE